MDKKYYDKKLAEIPEPILKKSIIYLKERISQKEKDGVLELYKGCGDEWFAAIHFGWGMGIRNDLRTNVALDDVLPDNNWDDYYVQLIEIAVGIREE